MSFGCIYGGECSGCMNCEYDDEICPECDEILDEDGDCPECDEEEKNEQLPL